jgi:hypothetical protein
MIGIRPRLAGYDRRVSGSWLDSVLITKLAFRILAGVRDHRHHVALHVPCPIDLFRRGCRPYDPFQNPSRPTFACDERGGIVVAAPHTPFVCIPRLVDGAHTQPAAHNVPVAALLAVIATSTWSGVTTRHYQ